MTKSRGVTEPWIATEAIVTSCRYQSRGLSTIAFGFQTTQRFRITFDYYAHGQLYSGEFDSRTAIPQNEGFSITYNPLKPEQNSRGRDSGASASTTRSPILTVGIAGSILLSLAWLVVLRSCR